MKSFTSLSHAIISYCTRQRPLVALLHTYRTHSLRNSFLLKVLSKKATKRKKDI